ncbi:hypothetical protein J6590_096376 [Homalodisca vitripennis]|nr:hypothetical protein J6590_096376 [Homalodisca vitripennis]
MVSVCRFETEMKPHVSYVKSICVAFRMSEMISATARFLDHLEKLVGERRELPIPHVMERIRSLLTERPSPPEAVVKHVGQNPEVVAFQEAIREMTAGKSPVVVDVQCLYSNTDYVLKEFAVKTDKTAPTCITIRQAPEENPFSRRNAFVVENLHGIRWEDGLVDESELRNYTTTLFGTGREVVVKCRDKVDILVNRLEVRRSDVRVMGGNCPRLEVLKDLHISDGCAYHRHLSHRLRCASKNVHAMACYRLENTNKRSINYKGKTTNHRFKRIWLIVESFSGRCNRLEISFYFVFSPSRLVPDNTERESRVAKEVEMDPSENCVQPNTPLLDEHLPVEEEPPKKKQKLKQTYGATPKVQLKKKKAPRKTQHRLRNVQVSIQDVVLFYLPTIAIHLLTNLRETLTLFMKKTLPVDATEEERVMFMLLTDNQEYSRALTNILRYWAKLYSKNPQSKMSLQDSLALHPDATLTSEYIELEMAQILSMLFDIIGGELGLALD